MKGDKNNSSRNILYTNTLMNDNDDLSTKMLRHTEEYNLDINEVQKLCVDSRIIPNIHTSASNTDIGKAWTKHKTLEKGKHRKYGVAIVQPNIAKMLATFTAMFPKITKQTKQKKTIVILDFSTYTTDIEAIKANVMNTIKEAYINHNIPTDYKKLLVINPIYMNKTVMKLFSPNKEYNTLFHCQVIDYSIS